MFYVLKNRSTFLEFGVCGMHTICTCVVTCMFAFIRWKCLAILKAYKKNLYYQIIISSRNSIFH